MSEHNKEADERYGPLKVNPPRCVAVTYEDGTVQEFKFKNGTDMDSGLSMTVDYHNRPAHGGDPEYDEKYDTLVPTGRANLMISAKNIVVGPER